MATIDEVIERVRERPFENEDAPSPTEDQIANAEAVLKVAFPPSYRAILLNCRRGQLPVDLFWVGDPWMKESCHDLVDFNRPGGYRGALLTIEMHGNGDQLCFDLRRRSADGEYPVVFYDHERDEIVKTVANNLVELLMRRLLLEQS